MLRNQCLKYKDIAAQVQFALHLFSDAQWQAVHGAPRIGINCAQIAF